MAPIGDPAHASGGIPMPDAVPTVSYNAVTISVAGRLVALNVRVTAPVHGNDLPILILSHGHGPSTFVCSSYGYAPLVDFWAAHGFAVLQPVHNDATYLGFRDSSDEDAPLFLAGRADDVRTVIDNLSLIESTANLAGRLDHSRIAAVGHSAGGHTIGLLSGMTGNVQRSATIETRIGARVMIGAPGSGPGMNGPAAKLYPSIAGTNFESMAPETLVVTGDNDHHAFFSDCKTWRREAFDNAPGPKTLFYMVDAGHLFGGISGFDAKETTDENPERVAVLRASIWAYLRSQLYKGDPSWNNAIAALAKQTPTVARVETKMTTTADELLTLATSKVPKVNV